MSGFHHEAVFYANDVEYLDGLLEDICVAGDGDGAELVCDLVQVRSSQAGNVVRLHMSLGSA
jgi:hypothetical protein